MMEKGFLMIEKVGESYVLATNFTGVNICNHSSLCGRKRDGFGQFIHSIDSLCNRYGGVFRTQPPLDAYFFNLANVGIVCGDFFSEEQMEKVRVKH